jgi:hypothetical protein
MNIIVPKKNRIPSWRPGQPKLGSFKSKHPDGKSVNAHLHPEDQFPKEELMKIANACRTTEVMGNLSLNESDPSFSESVRDSVELLDPDRKLFTGFNFTKQLGKDV